MTRSDDDIRWLSDQQPEVELPAPEVRSRARAAVMAHARRPPRPAAVPAARSAERPRRRRSAVFARPRRAIATAGAVATVAVAVFAATLAVSPSGRTGIDSVVAPGVADAQSLVLLANHVAAAPRHGDATLVLHRNAIRGRGTFTGADLYLDNGLYYYAETPSGLSAAVKAGPQDYSIKPIVDAMAATANADPQAARAAFVKAADPLYGGDVQHGPEARQDNVIWVSGIDVLGAAYGRSAVLAGALRALSTVHGVRVTHSRYHGVPVLRIAMRVPAEHTSIPALERALKAKEKRQGRITQADRWWQQKLDAQTVKHSFTPAHSMRATVDARTGALLRYTDIDLVVTYHVSRVDAARYGVR